MTVEAHEGWTTPRQEVVPTPDGFITVNTAQTGVLLAVGLILDAAGRHAGLHLAAPEVVVAAETQAEYEHVRAHLPEILRNIAAHVELHGGSAPEITTVGVPGTNQQAQE